ncbi:MAG: putative glycolipid-binding domain-containing protein [Candidatus Rokubacteria bacterium]|nr:putative glycolipid-binding domain-containing protein [Candidatus Rokubacteria bacterium]
MLFAPGVEHVRLGESAHGVVATGIMTVHRGDDMIAFHDDAPFRVRYRIECDAAWRVRAVHATASGGRGASRPAPHRWPGGSRPLPRPDRLTAGRRGRLC